MNCHIQTIDTFPDVIGGIVLGIYKWYLLSICFKNYYIVFPEINVNATLKISGKKNIKINILRNFFIVERPRWKDKVLYLQPLTKFLRHFNLLP